MYKPAEIAADPMIVLEYVIDCGREPSHAEIAIDLIGYAEWPAVDTIERVVAELAGESLVRVRGGLVSAVAPN